MTLPLHLLTVDRHPTQRKLDSHHEASHAVVAIEDGELVLHLVSVRPAHGARGYVVAGGAAPTAASLKRKIERACNPAARAMEPHAARREARGLVAGPAGESILLGSSYSGTAPFASRPEVQQACDLLQRTLGRDAGAAELERIWDDVTGTLRRDEVWRGVVAIANRLLAECEISGPVAAQLLRASVALGAA